MKEADCLSMQLTLFDKCECPQGGDNHDSLFGKTYQVHLQADQSVVLTLEPCLKASQKPVFQCLKMEDGQTPEWFNAQSAKLHGECSMLSFGVYPREEKESSLSQILQKKEDVPTKYYLSAKACAGILRRAERINKPLPESLETALKRQAGFADAPDGEEVSCEDTYTSQKVGIIIESSKSCTLAARDYKSPRTFVNYTGHPSLYDISHRNDGVRALPDGKANTLSARMGTGGGNVLITVQKQPSVEVLNDQGGLIMNISKNITGTLRAQTKGHDPIIKQRNIVRKLTPLECERLQGLPDNWTLIEDKSCTDAARYKAIGNGMAQPCADYVIQRIVDEVGKT